MTYDLLAPAMFASLVIVLLAGFPVAFSLAAIAGVFGLAGIATDHFDAAFLSNITFRIEGFFDNDNLLAIPLLVFMGMLLERTGLPEDMLLARAQRAVRQRSRRTAARSYPRSPASFRRR
jgi:TRAP-type mannitol/chloroaromatic compound transport system permease large subunit